MSFDAESGFDWQEGEISERRRWFERRLMGHTFLETVYYYYLLLFFETKKTETLFAGKYFSIAYQYVSVFGKFIIATKQ